MNDLIKYGLLGVGGYLLYQHFGGAAAIPAVATPVAPSSTIAPSVDLRPLMIAKAAALGFPAGSLLNTWQWDTIYQQVRGIPGPTAAQIGQADPTKLISVDEFLAGAGASGFSGLSGYVFAPQFSRVLNGRRV